MGQLISRRWMTARDEILALAETDPQIHYGQFVDVCKRHHLDDAEIVTLAELMHDLGQVVYYGSDEGLRDFVVLDPVLSFQPELDRLHSDVADVKSSINDLMAHAADTADAIRRIQRAVTTEITDCPRLFTLAPQHPSGRQRLRMDQQHFRLVLWCEHPGHWHPWPEASYSINQPREWILRIAPYATLVFRALQLLAPIASAVTGVVLTPDQLQSAQNELQLMTTLVAALPNQEPEDRSDAVTAGSSGQVTLAQGEAWRAVRILIFEQDPARAFRGSPTRSGIVR
jgi:internalin A